MVGSPYRPANLHEISWRDLQWVELEHQAGRISVQEEIVEDDTGMVTLVVVPNLRPVDKEMGSSEEGFKETGGPVN